jgi:hypothetical protein
MSGRKWQFFRVCRATVLSDLRLGGPGNQALPRRHANHGSCCCVLAEVQQHASLSVVSLVSLVSTLWHYNGATELLTGETHAHWLDHLGYARFTQNCWNLSRSGRAGRRSR